MPNRPLAIAVLIALAFAVASCRSGSSNSSSDESCGTEGCKILAPVQDDGDTFGIAIAVDGETMVAGAIVDDPETNAGAAYVYRLARGEWQIDLQIQATIPAPRGGDLFGGSVAIQGERVAIGAQGSTWVDPGATLPDRARAGSVFIFEPNDDGVWTQVQKIEAFDPGQDDFFGVSVAMDGDWLVVGAYLDDDGGSASGSVYVYQHDGTAYVFDQKIRMSQNGPNDRFGYDVAVDGDVLIASALFDSYFGLGTQSGSIAVYRHNGTDWIEEQVLLGGSIAAFDQMGVSIDIEGDTIVSGAHLYDGDEQDEGIVWVYRYFEPETGPPSRWSVTAAALDLDEVERIQPKDPTQSKLFGASVAIDDGRVIVGAHKDDDGGIRAGAAYVFEYDDEVGEWVQQYKLTAPDATTGDRLGASVALSGDNALAGAPEAGPGNNAAGAAYGYEL